MVTDRAWAARAPAESGPFRDERRCFAGVGRTDDRFLSSVRVSRFGEARQTTKGDGPSYRGEAHSGPNDESRLGTMKLAEVLALFSMIAVATSSSGQDKAAAHASPKVKLWAAIGVTRQLFR